MNKFSLVSNGYKILAIILTCIAIGLLILFLINIKIIPEYAIVIVIVYFLFCCSGLFFCYSHKITVNQKKGTITFANFKTSKVAAKSIKRIVVNTTNSINTKKYCFIDCILKDDTLIRISGYFSLGYVRATRKTLEVVNQIDSLLKKLRE